MTWRWTTAAAQRAAHGGDVVSGARTAYRASRRLSPGVDPADKYWPPVRRIDGAYGDRNLVCSCPPLTAYED